MYKEKEIWLGYSESPGDYSDVDLKMKHWRPLLITKSYAGTNLVRVTEASTKLKSKYIISIELEGGKILDFDKYSSFIIDAKNLKKQLKPIYGTEFNKKYKYIKRSSNNAFNQVQNKVKFEQLVTSGKYNQLSSEYKYKERIWNQFSPEEQQNRKDRQIKRIKKLKLIKEKQNMQSNKKTLKR